MIYLYLSLLMVLKTSLRDSVISRVGSLAAAACHGL